MLLSRCSNILRIVNNVKTVKSSTPNLNLIRSGAVHVNYRGDTVPEKKYVILAEVLGGFAWWWVLWHMYHEPGHVFGEWDVPEPTKWSDAELGIPPDN